MAEDSRGPSREPCNNCFSCASAILDYDFLFRNVLNNYTSKSLHPLQNYKLYFWLQANPDLKYLNF